MSRAVESRLRRLEAETPQHGHRTFVFGELEPGETVKRRLLAEGFARDTDLFIFTGVPQSDPSSYAMWSPAE